MSEVFGRLKLWADVIRSYVSANKRSAIRTYGTANT